MAQFSKRLDGNRWVSMKYVDSNNVLRDHTLYGNKIGYKANENGNGIFRIYADNVTFGVPSNRLIEFKMQDEDDD